LDRHFEVSLDALRMQRRTSTLISRGENGAGRRRGPEAGSRFNADQPGVSVTIADEKARYQTGKHFAVNELHETHAGPKALNPATKTFLRETSKRASDETGIDAPS